MNLQFTKVRTNYAKLDFLLKLSNHCEKEKKALLIIVGNEVQANFIDDFLWRHPPEGFLPHAVLSFLDPSEKIAIAVCPQVNYNHASVLLNLSAETAPLFSEVSTVHELLDLTDPKKEDISLTKYRSYERKGLRPKI